MPLNQEVLFPRRFHVEAKISKNPIKQLAHPDIIEPCTIEEYSWNRVTGWTVNRPSNQQVLIVSKRTSATPYGSVLLLPDLNSSPSRKHSLDGSLWLHPKPQCDVSSLKYLCQFIRESWINQFKFIEEVSNRNGDVMPGLRPPQMGAIYGALAHWKATNEVGTIVMPTGTGKTEAMVALLAKERPERLLIIVPTSALRDQISEKFLTFGLLQKFGVISNEVQLPLVGKIEHKFETAQDAEQFMQSCNVTVSTMQSIGQCDDATKQVLANNCTHLFIDEAHHAPARTWNAFRQRVSEASKPILQFTATPFRRDGKHIGGKIIFSYPLRKAQKEGYFKPIQFISIWEYNRDHADEAIAKRAIRALRESLNKGDDHILMARTKSIYRAEMVHSIYQKLALDLEPLIVHSQQSLTTKREIIMKLQERNSRIIVCVDMLGEGFDLPQLKVAALHDVHKSLAITIQFVGRFTRTSQDIGDATIIANSADADVEEALEDLFAKDSDWNFLLRRLSEGATKRQQKRSEFLEGFQNIQLGFPLQNIYPKMSTVVYKTKCDEWRPNEVEKILNTRDLLLEPTINSVEKVLIFIIREQKTVKWGQAKSVHDIVHDLYLFHWDSEQKLLFVNSTNNKGHHLEFAELIGGEDVELIRGEQIYRCLHDINRLVLSNLGLLHLFNRARQFTMHVGSDVKEGIGQASTENRKKSNLFSRGYAAGEKVTIGASHNGRIWSYRIAEDISEWIEWCHGVGHKLLDDSILTEAILEHAIIPEVIQERPSGLVPIAIEWPVHFLEKHDEAISVEICGKTALFFEVGFEITEYSDSGILKFHIALDDERAEYKVVFQENKVEYRPVNNTVATLSTSRQSNDLSTWFSTYPPSIMFEDTSVLEYNEIFRLNRDVQPYDTSKIEGWSWDNIDLKKESQYKAKADGGTSQLEFRVNSIQNHVIKKLKQEYQVNYDVIFDDDGAGEVADIVALKVDNDNLLVHLFHLKYSESEATGVRVGDFYEVCGQAQKSVHWRSNIADLFARLKLREEQRQKKYNQARFMLGDSQKLDELRRQSRHLYPKFQITIVQPGLKKDKVSDDILRLLASTELYLKETFDIPLKVIVSE